MATYIRPIGISKKVIHGSRLDSTWVVLDFAERLEDIEDIYDRLIVTGSMTGVEGSVLADYEVGPTLGSVNTPPDVLYQPDNFRLTNSRAANPGDSSAWATMFTMLYGNSYNSAHEMGGANTRFGSFAFGVFMRFSDGQILMTTSEVNHKSRANYCTITEPTSQQYGYFSVHSYAGKNIYFDGACDIVADIHIQNAQAKWLAKKVFELNPDPVDISAATVTLVPPVFLYDGQPKTPSVTAVLDGVTLVQGTDYTLTYLSNTQAGTGHAVLTGIGNYTGTYDAQFPIVDSPVGGFDTNSFLAGLAVGRQLKGWATRHITS